MFSKCCEIKTVSGQVMGKNSKTKKNKNGCSQNGGSVTGLITWRIFFLACYQNCGLESGGSPVGPHSDFLLGASELEVGPCLNICVYRIMCMCFLFVCCFKVSDGINMSRRMSWRADFWTSRTLHS